MNKKAVIGVTAALLTAAVFVLIGMHPSAESTDSSEAVQIVSDLRDMLAPELKGQPIENKGIVTGQNDSNKGREQYVCGPYSFYYDTAYHEVRFILYDAKDIQFIETEADTEKLQEKARTLLEIVKGKSLADSCSAAIDSNPVGTTVSFEYENSEVKISVGYVDLLNTGELMCAVFQTTDVPGKKENTISESQALTMAKNEAEKFLTEKKKAASCTFVEGSEKIAKRLIQGEVVYVCEMNYTVSGWPMEVYFMIYIDPANGRVISNYNNLS